MLYFVYLCLFVRLGLFKSYSCDLVFIIIFIFITVNHIVSLKHTHTIIFLGIFVKNSASGCCLAFAYFFAKFQPGFACKSVAYKKKRVYQPLSTTRFAMIGYSFHGTFHGLQMSLKI